MLVEQPSEGVLHRTGHRRENVCLDGGQVDYVLTDEPLGDAEAVWVDVAQNQELVDKIPHGLVDRDPFLAGVVKVDVAQGVSLDHGELLVLALTEPGVDHDGPVVTCVNQVGVISVTFHRTDDTLQLPGSRRAAREKEMPTDVHLESRVGVLGNDVPVTGQVHQSVVVFEHRFGSRAYDRQLRLIHLVPSFPEAVSPSFRQ